MSSPRRTGHQPESPRIPASAQRASTASRVGTQRSRKGCPECRKRKIKCDETWPECGQCQRSGRVCRVVDRLFRQHSYTFLTTTPGRPHPDSHREATSPKPSRNDVSHGNENTTALHDNRDPVWRESPRPVDLGHEPALNIAAEGSEQPELSSPPHHEQLLPPAARIFGNSPSLNGPSPETHNVSSRHQLAAIEPTVSLNPPNYFTTQIQDDQTSPGTRRTPSGICGIPSGLPEEDYQDRHEIAFFVRYFAEGPSRWMDMCFDQKPYFSTHAVLSSNMSTLVRYSACALAAKQLGQMKDPVSSIRQTPSHKLMLKAFSDSRLDFLWYGAKYYEKAIKTFFKEISHEDRSVSGSSPGCIYQSGLTPTSGHSIVSNPEEDGITFQIVAACILCQYEDLSATTRAYSGHLDGIYKLFHPHLNHVALHAPKFSRPLESSFWYFALHDVLNAYTTRRRCRADTENFPIWRRVGLPLDELGNLVLEYAEEHLIESILFRALVRLMAKLVNLDMADTAQWTHMEAEFNRWHDLLPASFFASTNWPHFFEEGDSEQTASLDLSHEAWFCNDLCAVAMAFYHMSRMILLINRPVDIFLTRESQTQSDLLSTYHSLQQDLRRHVMKVVPIARGMPDDRVRKHMLQPLYVAGRSLADTNDRHDLLRIMWDIEKDLGIFTEYRMKDLAEEWGMSVDVLKKIRDDGDGRPDT